MPLRDFSVTMGTWLIYTHQSVGFTPYGYHQGPWKATIVRHSCPSQAAWSVSMLTISLSKSASFSPRTLVLD